MNISTRIEFKELNSHTSFLLPFPRLSFSKDGRLLLSIAEDKTVAVSDWRSNTVIAITKGKTHIHIHAYIHERTKTHKQTCLRVHSHRLRQHTHIYDKL
jgi:WD40 repeat protein